MQPGASRWLAIGGAVGVVVGLAVGLGVGAAIDDGGKGSVAFPALTPTTAVVPPPTTVASPTVKIDHPVTGDTVAAETIVNGTVTQVPAGQRLWVFVQVGNNFYPQDGPVNVLPDGRWTAATFIGAPDDAGKSFVLYAGVAGPLGTTQFAEYLRHGRETGEFPGIAQQALAADVTLLDSVIVERR